VIGSEQRGATQRPENIGEPSSLPVDPPTRKRYSMSNNQLPPPQAQLPPPQAPKPKINRKFWLFIGAVAAVITLVVTVALDDGNSGSVNPTYGDVEDRTASGPTYNTAYAPVYDFNAPLLTRYYNGWANMTIQARQQTCASWLSDPERLLNSVMYNPANFNSIRGAWITFYDYECGQPTFA
jgi:hypothetical protein